MKKSIIYLNIVAALGIFAVAHADSGGVGSDGTIRDTNGTIVGNSVSTSCLNIPPSGAGNSTGNSAPVSSNGIGSDGTIRDTNGEIVGERFDDNDYESDMNVGRDGISADGTIRDTNGDIVGNAVSSRDIYGTRSTSGGLEADGTIRDVNGSIVGYGREGTAVDNTLNSDGTLISTNASDTSMREFER
jgi:hypothetical protein